MNLRRKYPSHRGRQRGNTLVLVSASLVVLLGMAGLAIDLVSLYVARSEAQRAADAAALAGAKVFVGPPGPGCVDSISGCVSGGPQEGPAKNQAIIAASQNSVAGQSPKILDSDISFEYPTPQNPTITVTVARDTTHGNPIPMMFMRVFGVTERGVSATATAEALNPSGSDIPVAAHCLKPWLLPNCDWNRMIAKPATGPLDPNANPNCPNNPLNPTSYASYFLVKNPDGVTSRVLNPGPIAIDPVTGAVSGGIVGEELTIKPGDPAASAAPSKFYPIFLPPGGVASSCPDQSQPWCTGGGGGGGGGGDPSGALYRQNIECCNQNPVTCGATEVKPITGDMVGPTQQGVDCLIHENKGNGAGQDILVDAESKDITAGYNNPYFPPDKLNIPFSDSLVTIPVYDGQPLCPGGSCKDATYVDVVGFMQIFVKEETNPSATVNVYIVDGIACGAGGGGGAGGEGGGASGTIFTGGATPFPVRLIHK